MARNSDEYAFDLGVAKSAADRWAERTVARTAKVEAAQRGAYVDADSPARLAKWANRQLAAVRESMPDLGAPPERLSDLINRPEIKPEEVTNPFLERIIGATRDFLTVAFLDRAEQAARCVGRIETNLGGGQRSYATGFLVSPRLLLTNHHVFKDAGEAAASTVEFDYQLDYMDQALVFQHFALDPAAFFLTDEALDFSLVAVKEISDEGRKLSDYGWCPLIKEEGKIRIDEAVNIVQHPRGEMKQIAIRDNKLLDLLEDQPFAHYETDTEPGSSGSPVFNDRWEVVALHHSGIPAKDATGALLNKDGGLWRDGDDPSTLRWVSNEGIRVSKLMEFIAAAPLAPNEEALRMDLLASHEPLPRRAERSNEANVVSAGTPGERDAVATDAAPDSTGSKITINVPLQITVSVGTLSAGSAAIAPVAQTPAPADEAAILEAVQPDPDYSDRTGYDPEFLGFAAALPVLTDATRADAVEVSAGPNKYELKYHHYSVLMNGARRIAFVSAVNFDPSAKIQYSRAGADRWFFDPRLPKEVQTGGEYYARNTLDRGHLTRRADAAWGDSNRTAKLANDDTFHFTNCSPQHERFNQSTKATAAGELLWGNIENHITAQANADQRLVSVYNGPVFRPDDRQYVPESTGARSTKPVKALLLPRQFWKIVAFKNDAGDPRAIAFVLSQEELIQGTLAAEEFSVGPFKPFQVKVSKIEALTGLDFGVLKTYDPLVQGANESFLEAASGGVRLTALTDMVL